MIGEFTKYEGQLEKTASHIVLVNPSNAGNMGTIMRSALGFGLNQMAIIRPAVDAFDPKVVRASMGAIFSTNFVYFEDFDEYQAQFGERELYPFMLDAKKSLHEIRPQGTFSLLFGNEGDRTAGSLCTDRDKCDHSAFQSHRQSESADRGEYCDV